ncbi:chloride channel protein [Sphingobacterium sp. LRF_L2]|uniref:chloride channel protein n=1 Tax=Sphingobacterium sp. LRF_L2 TaxID=3369421 RepID=UPI003F603AFD
MANNRLSFVKWVIVILLTSFIVGSISALFLFLLQLVTSFRENHLLILTFLPIAGVFIVWWYQYYGGPAQQGNNLLLKEYYQPSGKVPIKMAPMIIATTLLTHLFGGSAGREGTAVQYGGTIAYQAVRYFIFSKQEKRILLLSGIAAGFSSLFGTPFAGFVFALELVQRGKKIRWKAIIPVLATALLSNWTCSLYGNLHTHYPSINNLPTIDVKSILYIGIAAVLFGLTARLFALSSDFFSHVFKKIKQPLLRPFIGGSIVLCIVLALQDTKYIGLGIPTILTSFEEPLPIYDFFLKILLTTLTLSSGFKGGEVTPLFFIGATLGNALFIWIPLPMALLAATGFVAVFAGCTKTPLACTIMGIELFGGQAALFFLIGCFISYLASGKRGIYSAQKQILFSRL